MGRSSGSENAFRGCGEGFALLLAAGADFMPGLSETSVDSLLSFVLPALQDAADPLVWLLTLFEDLTRNGAIAAAGSARGGKTSAMMLTTAPAELTEE